MKRKLALTALLATLAAAALLYYYYGLGMAPSGQPPMVSLTAENFSTLKVAFNREPDSARVVMLVAPT